MKRLNVPSVQHLPRNWHPEPEKVCKSLVKLAQFPPMISYNPLYGAMYDMLVMGVPYEDLVKGFNQIKSEARRKPLLEILPLIRNHFDGISPDFFQRVQKRFYSVGRDLQIPFEPPMVYGVGGQLYFPWCIFWRNNPYETNNALAQERLSLFVTLVDEIILQDPDLDEARFEILDFSSQSSKHPRTLKIIDGREIPRLSEQRKKYMLEVFAEGYFKAKEQLANQKGREERTENSPSQADPNQLGLFD